MSFISSYAGPVYFLATRSADMTFDVTNLGSDKYFDTVLEQSVSMLFDVSNQCFTAPVNGLYHIKTHLSLKNNGTPSDDSVIWGYKIVRTSGFTSYRLTNDNFEGYITTVRELNFQLSLPLSLYSGDKIYLYGYNAVNNTIQTIIANSSYIMGYMISPMKNIVNPVLPYAEYATNITSYMPNSITQTSSLYTSTTTISSTTTGILLTPSTPAYYPYTHTLASTTNYVFAILIGGGGGGGGGSFQNGGQNGGGGGSGGTGAIKYGYFQTTPGANISINVGYGGLGGSSLSSNGIYTQYDLSGTGLNVGGSGQIGGSSSIVINGTTILEAKGGSGSLSVSNASGPITNTSIYTFFNGSTSNNAGGLAGAGGLNNGIANNCLFSGGYAGADGVAGSNNASSGTSPGGIVTNNSFVNFIVNNSGRTYFPPSIDTSNTAVTNTFAWNNNIVDLRVYGRGGAGGVGEGASTNGARPGSIGGNGAVWIFEYSA